MKNILAIVTLTIAQALLCFAAYDAIFFLCQTYYRVPRHNIFFGIQLTHGAFVFVVLAFVNAAACWLPSRRTLSLCVFSVCGALWVFYWGNVFHSMPYRGTAVVLSGLGSLLLPLFLRGLLSRRGQLAAGAWSR